MSINHENLLIITGAGASHDVINENIISPEAFNSFSYKAPLTKNLFYPPTRNGEVAAPAEESGYILTCLKEYPLAWQAGYDFLNTCQNANEYNLEKYLYDLKTNNNKDKKNQYWSMPLYLYKLFKIISNAYLPTAKGLPSNYRSLFNEITGSKFNQVVWLNLNYDLFADHAIKSLTNNELKTFDDYVNLITKNELKIKYIKAHGSVDWFFGISSKINITWEDIKKGNIPKDFEKYLSKEVYTLEDTKRYTEANFPDKWFPAISVPLGKYKPIYKKHFTKVKPFLKKATSILCIGFSALDEDILSTVKENIPEVNELLIVNGNLESGKRAYKKIARACNRLKVSEDVAVFDGGFSKFVGEQLKKWINQ